MRDVKKHEAFINLCRAARELREVAGDEWYRDQIKTILAPFNRVGRSIGLSHIRAKDTAAAITALRQRTAEFIKANEPVDALLERTMVESWCKKHGYALVKIDEKLASSLDKPKSLE